MAQSSEEEFPHTYKSNNVDKKKRVVQKFTAGQEELKIYLHKYSNDMRETAKHFLCLQKDFNNTVKTYDLFTALTPVKVINQFRRCLSCTAFDNWNSIRVNNSENTKDTYKEDLLDGDTVKNTKKYLERTKKPRSISVRNWIRRMKLMNSYLPLLVDRVTALNKETLLEECVITNFPEVWLQKFEEQGGLEIDTI